MILYIYDLEHIYDLLFDVICQFLTFFYPARFLVLVCFSDSLAGLLNWPFLNEFFEWIPLACIPQEQN